METLFSKTQYIRLHYVSGRGRRIFVRLGRFFSYKEGFLLGQDAKMLIWVPTHHGP